MQWAELGEFSRESVDLGERRVGPVDHRHRDRTVEPDHGRRSERLECIVETDDAPPVGVGGCRRDGVALRDGCLEAVVPEPAVEGLRSGQCGPPTADGRPVPAPTVLLTQRDRQA